MGEKNENIRERSNLKEDERVQRQQTRKKIDKIADRAHMFREIVGNIPQDEDKMRKLRQQSPANINDGQHAITGILCATSSHFLERLLSRDPRRIHPNDAQSQTTCKSPQGVGQE